MQDGKRSMQRISAYAGNRKDYVQGGGGNTSVKLDDNLMAIKASGYTLQEVTEEKGYVTVDYQKIRHYYNTVDAAEDRDFEKESLALNLGSVVLLEGMENRRPSVEVGFHSFLKKHVIHTHSVYANILCCSAEGRAVAASILQSEKFVFIPYIDPCFRLTLAIKQAVDEYIIMNGTQPQVILMENHGIVVHGDDDGETMALHESVNDKIREYFNLPEFPVPVVRKTDSGYASDTGYLKRFLDENNADEAYFGALTLYPDQLVYIGGKLGDTVRIQSGEVLYAASQKEAEAIEETLAGVVYVINEIQKAGLTLRELGQAGADFINNWESEKYRAQLIK